MQTDADATRDSDRSETARPEEMAALHKALHFQRVVIERIVWGTDWPHTNSTSGRPVSEVTPLLQIDDGRLLNQLPVWAPEAALRTTILVENPARLYAF
jgi:predicted TIM-barrel fold metal-dependent hydrolase